MASLILKLACLLVQQVIQSQTALIYHLIQCMDKPVPQELVSEDCFTTQKYCNIDETVSRKCISSLKIILNKVFKRSTGILKSGGS